MTQGIDSERGKIRRRKTRIKELKCENEEKLYTCLIRYSLQSKSNLGVVDEFHFISRIDIVSTIL